LQQFVQFIAVKLKYLSNTEGHRHGWRWICVAFNFAQIAEREALHLVICFEALLDFGGEFTLRKPQNSTVKPDPLSKGVGGCLLLRWRVIGPIL
jgi:hypothetical protein